MGFNTWDQMICHLLELTIKSQNNEDLEQSFSMFPLTSVMLFEELLLPFINHGSFLH